MVRGSAPGEERRRLLASHPGDASGAPCPGAPLGSGGFVGAARTAVRLSRSALRRYGRWRIGGTWANEVILSKADGSVIVKVWSFRRMPERGDWTLALYFRVCVAGYSTEIIR